MFNVVDVAVERRLFFTRAYQDRVHTDYAPALANHLDLAIADVAFDVVIFSRIRV